MLQLNFRGIRKDWGEGDECEGFGMVLRFGGGRREGTCVKGRLSIWDFFG